jgi:hypothetical protein
MDCHNIAANVPVACAVADIKVECMDEESKDEERKDD